MSKKLFIQTINSMVDMETIFIAHPSYWSDVYDRLQAGRTADSWDKNPWVWVIDFKVAKLGGRK